MRKYVWKVMMLLGLIACGTQSVQALCIGCGCQDAYHFCLEGDFPPGDLSLQGHCQNNAECCKQNRRSCHGTGIRFQLFALSSDELDHVNMALSEFESPVTIELNRSTEMLNEGVESNSYEQRLLYSTLSNAMAPMLSSEEGRRIEEVVLDFEVPFGPWLDRDNPSGVGDFETLANFVAAGLVCPFPVSIECETVDGIDWHRTGEVVTCSDSTGLVCLNANQPAGVTCSDYRVRFRC